MKPHNCIRLSFGGDIMLLKEQLAATTVSGGGDDLTDYLSRLKPLFSRSDFVLANLETPVAHSQPLTDSDFSFNAPPTLLDALKDVGLNFLSTANNHCLDRGIAGLVETIDALDDMGIAHSGTYKDKALARQQHNIFNIGGLSVGVICCTYGTNSEHNGVMLGEDDSWRVSLTKKQPKRRRFKFDPSQLSGLEAMKFVSDDVSPAAISNAANNSILDDILSQATEMRPKVDILVIMPHVGGQFNPAPGAYTTYVMERLKETGADLIVGSHPHTSLRGEWLDGGRRWMTYSLGNMCFTPGIGWYLPNTLADYGIILHADIDRVTKAIAQITFNVIKSVVTDTGAAGVTPVSDLLLATSTASERERLALEVEAVVNRFAGRNTATPIAAAYPFNRPPH